MELNTLRDLLVFELKDLYSAEQQIVSALPRMIETAQHEELRSAFQEHLDVTREQVRRLETIFDEIGEDPRGQKCKGMEGLVREGQDLIQQGGDPAVCDAGLIGAAQRIEHYEIAGYGTARTFAERLGMDDVARTLQQTLDEEGDADHRLTALAERVVNPDAERAGVRGGMRAAD